MRESLLQRGEAMGDLDEAFRMLAEETEDFCLPVIRCAQPMPTSPLDFQRRFVSPGVPAVFECATARWPARDRWQPDLEYLVEKVGDKVVTVNFTPDGFGDHVRDNLFIMPEERRMPFREFAENLLERGWSAHRGVPYLSYQNDSLRVELPELLPDIETEGQLDVLRSTFRSHEDEADGPDAVNIWIGDGRSTTTLHKDPYENLYYVLSGEKVFTLFPPTSIAEFSVGSFPVARYKQNQASTDRPQETSAAPPTWTFVVEKPQREVPWVVDHPETGITLHVQKGQCLYLPSLWYHRVQQVGVTTAVNFWYDMSFDYKWVYFQFLRRITIARNRLRAESDPDHIDTNGRDCTQANIPRQVPKLGHK